MLTIVPLDTVRSIFEFLDLESLVKCRTLCKYMKYVIDNDYVLINYRLKLIRDKTDNIQRFKELQATLEELYETKFENLPDPLLIWKISLDNEPITAGDHLWIEEKKRHAIVARSDSENNWRVVVMKYDGVYEEIPFEEFRSQGECYKLQYIKWLKKNETIGNAMEMKRTQKPERSDIWTEIQFAFYCKAGKYMPVGQFENLKIFEQRPQGKLSDSSYY
ncbi:MAG: F-box protein [Nitrososphaerota archaeon]